MKTTPFALAAGLALLAVLAPAASASHMGPCTHEYFDAAVYAVENYKTGGYKVIVPTLVYCATNTGGVETTEPPALVLP